MGRSLAYGHRNRSVQVHMGYDALDAAEDLDINCCVPRTSAVARWRSTRRPPCPRFLPPLGRGRSRRTLQQADRVRSASDRAELLAVVDGISAAGP